MATLKETDNSETTKTKSLKIQIHTTERLRNNALVK